jgi:hypothetical protein
VFDFLNPRHTFALTIDPIVPNKSLFKALAQHKERNEGFLKSELFLYHSIDACIEDLMFAL